jgi:hypothetical protein
MKTPFLFLVIGTACLVLPACISHISVKPVNPGENVRGLRYHLPQPVIVGKPQPDGSITYSVETIPDPDREYAIDAWSLMSNHTAKLTREAKMFLTKAELKQDTTGVAAQLLKSAGNVGAEFATAVGAQKAAERKDAATAASDRATKLAAAASDLRAKELAFAKAQLTLDDAEANLAAATNTGDAKKIEAAQEAISKAKLALKLAEADRNAARNLADALDDPSVLPDTAVAPKASRAAGPILLRIVEDKETGSIRLEPMIFKMAHSKRSSRVIQRQFDTVTATKPAEKTDKNKDTGQAPSGTQFILTKPLLGSSVAIPAKQTVIKEKSQLVELETKADVTGFLKALTSEQNKVAFFELAADTPPGKYQLSIALKSTNGQLSKKTVKITVQ